MKILYPPFHKHITDTHLIKKNATVIAAFSGGKDSVTLVHLLRKLQQDIPFKLIAAYFNHKIRNDHQDEEKWIRRFCADRKIPLETDSADVPLFSDEHRMNLENAASMLRYRFLNRLSGDIPDSKIATGHTKSDLAETFFINLFRGSGSRGLSGIYLQKGKKIIRPLLIFSHGDIQDFLKRNRISFYQDVSNRDDTYIRNNIRHNLIPALKKIEPEVENRIYRTVSMVQDQHDYLMKQSRNFLKKKLILKQILPMKAVRARHVALQRYIIREYIRQLKGDLLNVGFDHVETILKQTPLTAGSVPGVTLRRSRDFLFPRKLRIPEYDYSMTSPGSFLIAEIQRTVHITETGRFAVPGNNLKIITPRESLQFPLRVRNARKGDHYRKLNSSVNQRVFEMIRSSGFPAQLRNYCPLFLDAGGDPIWVAGSPICDRFKVSDPGQKPFLEISIH